MIRKDAYFGTAEIKENKILRVDDPLCCNEISVRDCEIIENKDSMECVMFTVDGSDNEGKETQCEFFVHKKDCLQLATFLLNLHNEYALIQNELDFDSFKRCFKLNDYLNENDNSTQ